MKTVQILTFLLSVAIAAVTAWWLLEPASPPSVSVEQSARNAKGEPQNEFRAGEILYIFSKQRLVLDIPRRATQSIWNEDTATLAVRYAGLLSPTPPVDGLTFPVPLPTYLPPGNYTHRVLIGYRLNPLREEEFSLPNVHFRIVQ